MRLDRRAFSALALGVLLSCSLPQQPLAKDLKTNQKQQQQRRRADDGGPVVARITVAGEDELNRLVALGLDLLEMREGDDLFALTTPAEVRRLGRDGWKIRVDKGQTDVLLRQRAALREARAKAAAGGTVGASSFQGGYLTVPEMRARLEARAAEYPNLARFFVYGASWERLNRGDAAGHELFGIELTNAARPGPKPTFFLMAAIHARELSTSELALRLVDHLLAGYGADADATWLLDEHRVVVVPTANPDGRRIAEQGVEHRKNTNDTRGQCPKPGDAWNHYGADLNRNHDFKWGTVDAPTLDPCSQTYPGAAAASEPETAALQDLVRSYFPDQRGPLDTDAAPADTTGLLITLHSYANLVMWPWGHTSAPAPNDAGLARIGTKFADYNGYTPQQANRLYPSSGKTDEWAYGELGIPAYVFEVGIGEGECGGFMPPYRCLDEGYEGSFWPRNLPAFLHAARIARAPYQLAEGPSPEAVAAFASADGGAFEVRAQFDERLSGGQRVAAAEYYVDTPPWRGGTPFPMTARDGNFDSAVEAATAAVGPLEGVRTIYVRAQDEQGNWGPVRALFSPGETPSSCAFSVAPASQSFDAGGGAGAVNVTATRGCGWDASVASGASWITITSAGFGTGDGRIGFTVAPNSGSSARTGAISVAGQTFSVTQATFTLSSFALNPTSVKGGQSSVGTLSFNGTAPAGGSVVSLTSSNPTAASAPASVTVPAGATSHAFNVTTLPVAANTSASITARHGGVTWSILLTVTPAALAPASLTATPGAGKVDLKWADKSTNESGFHVERCEGLTCTNFAQIATVKANTTTYRNTSLGARRAYRYRVRAYNASGYSVYSNVAAATTK